MEGTPINILWNTLTKHPIQTSHFFGRPLVLVSHEQFERMQSQFMLQRASVNKLNNYRSQHVWKHIHAVERTDGVQVHIDYGNLNYSFFLLFPHFILDVIPYFLWCLLKRKTPYKF